MSSKNAAAMDNDGFLMDSENSVSAMERIIESLTRSQQVVLFNALRQSDRRDVVTVDSANERTVGSLMRGEAPLIRENRAHRRVLTGLGRAVADYLIKTREFKVVDLQSIVPDLTPSEEDGEGD